MKFNKQDVTKRREFMKTLIAKDPKKSGAALNAQFQKHFGDRMRINTVYDLKEELGYDRKGDPKPKVGGVKVDGAGKVPDRHRSPGDGLGAFPMVVNLETGDTPLGVAQRLLEQLSSRGVINLAITGKSDRWFILEPAT